MGAGPKASRTWSSSLWTRGTIVHKKQKFLNSFMILIKGEIFNCWYFHDFTPKAFLGGLKYTFVEDRTVAYLNIYS